MYCINILHYCCQILHLKLTIIYQSMMWHCLHQISSTLIPVNVYTVLFVTLITSYNVVGDSVLSMLLFEIYLVHQST